MTYSFLLLYFCFHQTIETVDVFIFENISLVLKRYNIKVYHNNLSQQPIATIYRNYISQKQISKTYRQNISPKHITRTDRKNLHVYWSRIFNLRNLFIFLLLVHCYTQDFFHRFFFRSSKVSAFYSFSFSFI